MDEVLYYPCLKDWDTGEISKRVGPAMTWEDAVQHLKQHYPGAWQNATASPQRVAPPVALNDEPSDDPQ